MPRQSHQWSVADALQLSWGRVGDALVAPQARTRVAEACRWLPAALTTGVYLECRLGHSAEAGRRADVIIQVSPEQADIIAGTNPAIALADALLAHHAWQQLQHFCRAWRSPGSSWGGWVDHLWLEFDLAPEAAPRVDATSSGPPRGTARSSQRIPQALQPLPSVFVGLRPGLRARADAQPLARCIGEIRALLQEQRGSAEAQERALHAVLQAAPAEAEAPYVGFMLARRETATRLYLMHVRPDRWPGYLQRTGWPGAHDALLEHFGPLIDHDDAGRASPIGMGHLDVAPSGAGPRIGFEFTCERLRQRQPNGALDRLLRRATEHRLCTPAEAQALRAWPGGERTRWPQQLWDSVVLRHVHCLKLVFDGARPPEAKAYLLARAIPVDHTAKVDRHLYPIERQLCSVSSAGARASP